MVSKEDLVGCIYGDVLDICFHIALSPELSAHLNIACIIGVQNLALGSIVLTTSCVYDYQTGPVVFYFEMEIFKNIRILNLLVT